MRTARGGQTGTTAGGCAAMFVTRSRASDCWPSTARCAIPTRVNSPERMKKNRQSWNCANQKTALLLRC